MRVQLRFSKTRDKDFILLHKYPYFDDAILYREAIEAFVRNEDYTIDIPNFKDFTCDYKDQRLSLAFSDKDKEVISFLKRSSSNKNLMLLTILRNKFSRPIINHFFNDDKATKVVKSKETKEVSGGIPKEIFPDVETKKKTKKSVSLPVVEDNNQSEDFETETFGGKESTDEFDLFAASMNLMNQLNKRHEG